GGLAFLLPAPDVVIADAVADRERAFILEDALPEIPLHAGARQVRAQGVHDAVAGVEDEFRLLLACVDVAEAGGHAFAAAELGLDVDIGDVRYAQDAVAVGGGGRGRG